MSVDSSLIFQIAGIGIVIAFITTILKQLGKEEYAHWATLVGFLYVLYLVTTIVSNLFQRIKAVFLFQ
ncbi:MAG: stage sporulation protein [Bacillales bacterium]|jgi:stage III sporulation protein AC|nr:stage sporulation protein [Bacillales bacterium]